MIYSRPSLGLINVLQELMTHANRSRVDILLDFSRFVAHLLAGILEQADPVQAQN